MIDLIRAANQLQEELDSLGLPNCIIGGVALQAWGEMRVTRDVDFTVITHFEDEAGKILKILALMEPRMPNALLFALQNRVILGYLKSLVPVDIGLGGFDYELGLITRARTVKFTDDLFLRVCGPEDLIITKVFAGRERDWDDVAGVVARQGKTLDWALIYEALPPLLETVEDPERITRLNSLRGQ